jgi:WD40 repeat protein
MCSLSPDGTKLAISFSKRDSKKGIRKNPIVMDLSTKNQIASLENDNKYVDSIKFSYDGRKIVSVSEKSASVWDAMTGTQLRLVDVWEGSVSWFGSPKLVKYAEFNPTGDRLVTTYGDEYGATDKAGKSAKVWDITNLKMIFSL